MSLTDKKKASSKTNPSDTVHSPTRLIEVDVRSELRAIAFLRDGKRIVSSGEDGKIRCWRTDDGSVAAKSLDAGSRTRDIAASPDGKWVVAGTDAGEVKVWHADNLESTISISWKIQEGRIFTVDVSPDGTQIATGSRDMTVCVWSLSTGQRVLGPWKHDHYVAAVKFSPDGRFVATGTQGRKSVRIYDTGQNVGLVDAPIMVGQSHSATLAWTKDGKLLFALSQDGIVHCLDASTGETRAEYPMLGSNVPTSIAPVNDGTLLAVSASSWVWFWDTRQHVRVGPLIPCPSTFGIESIAVSENYDLAMRGANTIAIRSLCDVMPSFHSSDVQREDAEQSEVQGELDGVQTRSDEIVPQLRSSNCTCGAALEKDGLLDTIQSLRAQERASKEENAHLKGINEQLRSQLSESEHAAVGLDDMIGSLQEKVAQLEQQLGARRDASKLGTDSIVQWLRSNEKTRQESENIHGSDSIDMQGLLSLGHGSKNVRKELALVAARIVATQELPPLPGISDVSTPIASGEGQRALGRLLQEVLTRSGDVTVLAWTGKTSDYNSCLPAEIDVYRNPASSHIPSPITDARMDELVARARLSPGYLDSAVTLYDRVTALPSSRLTSGRLSLSCIAFPLRGPLVPSGTSGHVYRAVTSALGNVEIKTTEDLSGMKQLVLVHPWLPSLLDPSAVPFVDDDDDGTEPLSPIDADDVEDEFDMLSPSLPPTASLSPDKQTRALRLFVRLRQQFGALLLAPLAHDVYRWVAADRPIVVQLLGSVSPLYLAQKVQTVDVL